MNIDDFFDLLGQNIPTARQFVDFAQSMGYRIFLRDDGKPVLRAPRDPVSLCLAKLLSREPYRSRVLDYLASDSPAIPEPETQPEPLPQEPEEEWIPPEPDYGPDEQPDEDEWKPLPEGMLSVDDNGPLYRVRLVSPDGSRIECWSDGLARIDKALKRSNRCSA